MRTAGHAESAVVWETQRNVIIDPTGKHAPVFDSRFPLILRFYRFTEKHRLAPSYHDYLEVVYAFRGQGLFHIGGTICEFCAGQVLLVGSHLFHLLEPAPGGSIDVATLYFMPELLYQPGADASRFDYLRVFYSDLVNGRPSIRPGSRESREVACLIDSIRKELDARQVYWQLTVRNSLERIVLMVMRHRGSLMPDPEVHHKRAQDVRRLAAVFKHISEHYAEPISLERAAAIACMSPSYFCRFFKRVAHRTFVDYVQRLRIDRARELLLSTSLPITRISEEVGFDNHSYFDRVFRRYVGVSPRMFATRAAGTGSRPPD